MRLTLEEEKSIVLMTEHKGIMLLLAKNVIVRFIIDAIIITKKI